MKIAEALIAVFDAGKTHAKLALVGADSGVIEHCVEILTPMRPGPFLPQIDLVTLEQWAIERLAAAPGRERISTLVPIAHGAAAALVDERGNALLAPDYEAHEFEAESGHYEKLRDPFSQTFSPSLPLGLNLGRQLHFVQTRHPALFDKATRILLYPQYWAWRFSGTQASEVTSLGCHSDLWRPREGDYSALAVRQGWSARLPALRKASDVIGTVTPALARATGLDPHCRVLCGIHDSNASYLAHLVSRPLDEPMTVVSSGTWTIVMSRGSPLDRLVEEHGMLANVDAFGVPVATGRHMGGRDFQLIAGERGRRCTPTARALESVLEKGAMVWPTRLEPPAALTDEECCALATVYSALMVDVWLAALAARGDVVIDGPLARNALFPPLLRSLLPSRKVLSVRGEIGTAAAARALASSRPAPVATVLASALSLPSSLERYREAWRERLPEQLRRIIAR
jgi:L-fuculokinase